MSKKETVDVSLMSSFLKERHTYKTSENKNNDNKTREHELTRVNIKADFFYIQVH